MDALGIFVYGFARLRVSLFDGGFSGYLFKFLRSVTAREGPLVEVFHGKVTELIESTAAESPCSRLGHMLEDICAREGYHVAEGRLVPRDDLTLGCPVKDSHIAAVIQASEVSE